MRGVRNGVIFGGVAPRLLELGWSPIPLSARTKFPPPRHWTGYRGRRPDAAQVKRWCAEDPNSNVALRLHPDVVGVDVDAYHGGLDGLAELQASHGQLPPTWASTSRDDGSGIRLYRVPNGWHLQTDPAQGVDMIQAHHRYVVAAPSIHPEGRVYRWVDLASGEVVDELDVEPGDLPDLPWGWLEGLKVENAGKLAERPATPQEVEDFIDAHPGTPEDDDVGMRGPGAYLEEAEGSRHDRLITAACWAMREVAAGLYGAEYAINFLTVWWARVMDDERRRKGGEFNSAMAWAIAEALADPDRVEQIRRRNQWTFTDLGNARRLIDGHGAEIRHVPELGCWFTWEGTRWEQDITGQVMRYAKATVDRIPDEANDSSDDNHRKAVIKHWTASQGAGRIRSMVEVASTERGLPVRVSELDADPWMLNTATGALDLRTGDLRPHRQEDLMTKRAAEYRAGSPIQAWLTFVDQIFDGDQELIEFIQRSVGVALTSDVSEQYLWFLHGAGANGKSTFLTTIRGALGDYGIQLDGRILMATDHEQHPTGLTDLRGVRLATTIEVEQGRKMAEALVKQLTGGDPIRARRMHKDFFEFMPTHKLWVAANHLPKIDGTDHAIWRRILLIPFTRTFEGDNVDKRLPGKLAAETPGILAWAVEGCLKWQRDGLQIPEKVLAATASYRADEDHVGRFLADCCAPDPNDFILAAQLRDTYVSWCSSVGENVWTVQAFGRELTSRGYDSVKVGGKKRWLGLHIADGLDLRGVA